MIAAKVVAGMTPGIAGVIQLLMSAVVAGLTVGGKAFGKSLAMNNSTAIIHTAAKLLYQIKQIPQRLATLMRRA